LSSKEEDEQLSLKGSLAAVRKSARAAALIQAVPIEPVLSVKDKQRAAMIFLKFHLA
jgi:hypothetical protein